MSKSNYHYRGIWYFKSWHF